MTLSARRAAKCRGLCREHRGNSFFPCTPSPDRRLIRAVDPCFQIDSTAENTCYHFESIRSCWQNPGCRQGCRRLPPSWIPGFRPPEAQKAAGYASPGRVPLPGRVHPAAFHMKKSPIRFKPHRTLLGVLKHYSIKSPLPKLHLLHKVRRLSRVVAPPFDQGTI